MTWKYSTAAATTKACWKAIHFRLSHIKHIYNSDKLRFFPLLASVEWQQMAVIDVSICSWINSTVTISKMNELFGLPNCISSRWMNCVNKHLRFEFFRNTFSYCSICVIEENRVLNLLHFADPIQSLFFTNTAYTCTYTQAHTFTA